MQQEAITQEAMVSAVIMQEVTFFSLNFIHIFLYIYIDIAAPRSEVHHERIPVEKRYIDWEERQKIEYIPIEKVATDYVEIEHRKEYMPVPRLEKRVEYVPMERYDEKIDYVPYETSHVTKNSNLDEGNYGNYGYVDNRNRLGVSGGSYSSGYRGYNSGSGYGYGYPNYYSQSSYSPNYRNGYGSGYGSGYGNGYGSGYGSGYRGGYGSGFGGGYGGGYSSFSGPSMGYSNYARPYSRYY